MKQEDKDLLLKDLCARLPYGVKIELMPITRGKCVTLTPIILQDYFISDDVNYLPYLRPMSSMTEEEKEEFLSIIKVVHWEKVGLEETGIMSIDLCECYDNDGGMKNLYDVIDTKAIDWLNAHHFDFRNLIDKGLAIDCTNLNIY